MSRIDENRADRRRAKQAQARPAPPPPLPPKPPPPPRGERKPPWPPGTSGNPDGYSNGRRREDAILGAIRGRNADGFLGAMLRAKVSNEQLARIMFTQVLRGKIEWFRLMLELTEQEPTYIDDPDKIIPDLPDMTLDPRVIERLMAQVALEAEAALELGDGDLPPPPGAPASASPPPPAPSSTASSTPARARPSDVSQADWLRMHPGWTEGGRNGTK
jgi:hypothetical protein